MYTKQELKTKLRLLIEVPMEYGETRLGMIKEWPEIALIPLAMQAEPVTNVTILAKIGEEVHAGFGQSICGEQDEFSDVFGQRLAADKAVEDLVANLDDQNYIGFSMNALVAKLMEYAKVQLVKAHDDYQSTL